ncbi:C-C motif chemokine 20 isoform X1 [Ictalurus furcatus]|uniref:C-C motif chemokine 20 isoform X1 n=1 Tax=Ictalurus furcatus TaxID=66913 RepID=UPI00235054EC|nr:C-C motif chemokine 20 isoform X1 [Ictalurus furcatus]
MSLKVLTNVFAGCWLLCMFCLTTDALSLYSNLNGPLKHACCVKYTRTPVNFNQIKGFAEQSSREVCRIDAIIFLTKRNQKVCASAKDEWVRNILARLSSKMKKMSQQPHNKVNHTPTWSTSTDV